MRSILIVGALRMAEIIHKGNPWQLRSYEAYFDIVKVAYLIGSEPATLSNGKTELVSLGVGNKYLDILLAPWTLYRYVKRRGGFSVVQVPDVFFLWWTTLLLRLLLKIPVVMVPVCIPEQLYLDSSRTPTGLPRAIERIMVWLSFKAASVVLTGYSLGAFVTWLRAEPMARNKLLVVDTLPDAVIADWFVSGTEATPLPRSKDDAFTLVCVSRLHPEKLLADLVQLMGALRGRGYSADRIKLRILGEGVQRPDLEAMAVQLGVSDAVDLPGAVDNNKLVPEFLDADVFVSPLTGSSLREAAFCRLPIVAYDRDWLKDCLVHEEHALLVASRDIEGMADVVLRLYNSPALRENLGKNARELAMRLWSLQGCEKACSELHQAVVQGSAR